MTASAYSTLGLEFLVEAEVSEDLVRLMVVGATGRRLLFMWDMTREQAATLTAVIDGRLSDYLDAADVPANHAPDCLCDDCVTVVKGDVFRKDGQRVPDADAPTASTTREEDQPASTQTPRIHDSEQEP